MHSIKYTLDGGGNFHRFALCNKFSISFPLSLKLFLLILPSKTLFYSHNVVPSVYFDIATHTMRGKTFPIFFSFFIFSAALLVLIFKERKFFLTMRLHSDHVMRGILMTDNDFNNFFIGWFITLKSIPIHNVEVPFWLLNMFIKKKYYGCVGSILWNSWKWNEVIFYSSAMASRHLPTPFFFNFNIFLFISFPFVCVFIQSDSEGGF